MSDQGMGTGGEGYGAGMPPQNSGAPIPQAPATPRAKPAGGDLFTRLGGTPSNIAVALGFLLVLLAAMLPECRTAGARAAIARHEEAQRLAEAELDEFRAGQERERQAERANPMAVDPTAEQRRQVALQAQQTQVRTRHSIDNRRQEAIEAAAAVQGMRAHLIINWIGRLLLILGLLMMTARAEGVKQKVYLAVLLLVMFSSLTGVRLDFGAQGRLGDGGESPVPTVRIPSGPSSSSTSP